jgi:hypothetical protein
MPVAFIQEFRIQGDDRSTTNYDAVQERLNTRDDPPEGGIFHSAGFDEEAGVFRIFDVWETREQAERFMRERLEPVLQELMSGRPEARPPDREAWYELHDVMSR